MCHRTSCGLKTNDMERIYVVPNDVCNITGKKLRWAQELLKNLRLELNKTKRQVITKTELATYLGIDPDDIKLD